jgi:thiol-disulfide isomerase/thioredoxin
MYNELFTNFFFESRKTEQLSAAFKEEYLPVWKSLIPNLPDSSQLTTAPGFSYLVMRYKSLREISDSGRLIFSPGNPQLNSYRYYNHLFKGRMGEYVLASLMVQGIGHHKFEQEWIPVYEDFKAQYPKSPLLPYLQQEVDKVVAFNNAKADAGVKFMPASDTINSIAGLLERLKGKVTYIDLWATWCAPCRAELQFSIAQHHEIAKMGVQQVYLSIDNKSNEEEWKKMAGSLPLKGLNLRSNDTLHKDINRQVPKFVGIPRYIIVDKNGKIVEWDAKRPSDKLELFKQLKQYL